jgi:hypothetical protein
VALVTEHDVEIVYLSGDERALGLLENLPLAVRPMVRRAEGTIEAGGSEVETAAATLQARRTVEVLQEFEQRRGRGERFVEGVRETFAGLNAGRVEKLLVHFSTADRRRAWFGVEALPVAIDHAGGRRVGLASPRQGRLVKVAIRATLGTGGTICFVPRHGTSTPGDGVGGLNRV